MANAKNILLTIDVEDWFQAENQRPWFSPTTWEKQQLRVEQNTRRLFDLFDQFGKKIKATFFVLGWVAKRLSNLVREIHNRGHEVASHGYGHQMCNQMDKHELTNDLLDSKHLLEDTIGKEVRG